MLKGMKQWFKGLWNDEEGIQTLEVMLIIGVVVIIALMFRNKIEEWITTLLNFGDGKVDEIIGEGGGGGN